MTNQEKQELAEFMVQMKYHIETYNGALYKAMKND